jgi:hypothetical protein
MKANELRIGNYVVIDGITTLSITVLGVLNDKIYYSPINNDEFDKDFYSLMSYVKPIPLTEEWLLKFGFEKYIKETDYDSIYELKNINIPKSGYFEFSVGFIENEINIFLYSGECLRHIKYIHQLQNLYFALTGEELTIKE